MLCTTYDTAYFKPSQRATTTKTVENEEKNGDSYSKAKLKQTPFYCTLYLYRNNRGGCTNQIGMQAINDINGKPLDSKLPMLIFGLLPRAKQRKTKTNKDANEQMNIKFQCVTWLLSLFLPVFRFIL